MVTSGPRSSRLVGAYRFFTPVVSSYSVHCRSCLGDGLMFSASRSMQTAGPELAFISGPLTMRANFAAGGFPPPPHSTFAFAVILIATSWGVLRAPDARRKTAQRA